MKTTKFSVETSFESTLCRRFQRGRLAHMGSSWVITFARLPPSEMGAEQKMENWNNRRESIRRLGADKYRRSFGGRRGVLLTIITIIMMIIITFIIVMTRITHLS